MNMTQQAGEPSILETALASFKQGNLPEAAACLQSFISKKFSLDVSNLQIREDTLSLNSINGTFDLTDGTKLFFKFHMEESEETVAEYYRAELLAKAGYPVEQPLYISKEPGEQILIYPYKDSERLADMCRRLEIDSQQGSDEYDALIKGQEELDKICADKALKTLRKAQASDLENEPLLQLFYWRLVDTRPDGSHIPGGRHHRFYVGHDFTFPDNITLNYNELSALQWNVNARSYNITLDECFKTARKILAPDYYTEYPACTAHGDAHNGNVWANKNDKGSISLSWFDPAFAGNNIPVLLAEVKTLFHNIFAHANWLYDAQDADPKLDISCKIENGTIYVSHNWELPALRRAFLDSKLNNFWIPVLRELKSKELLSDEWEAYVRAALFCCPTLVMNLRANAGSAQNAHTPRTSLLGLSIAIMLFCQPDNAEDDLSQFFTKLRSAL